MIKTAEFVKSSVKVSDCPQRNIPEYAFIGRSNVGKSSLINLITGRKKLAKASGTPGKTQLINHFLIDESWYLVDLPGYGWAQTNKTNRANWKIMIEEYLLQRVNLVSVFLLIDSRHEPQKMDLDFIQWLGENTISFSLVFTKTDKLTKLKIESNTQRYKNELYRSWEELPPLFMSSVLNRFGDKEILDFIQKINRSLEK